MFSFGGDIERDGKRSSVIDQHSSFGFADLFCGQLKRGEESPQDSYGRLEDADHTRIVERHVISNPVPGGTVQVQYKHPEGASAGGKSSALTNAGALLGAKLWRCTSNVQGSKYQQALMHITVLCT